MRKQFLIVASLVVCLVCGQAGPALAMDVNSASDIMVQPTTSQEPAAQAGTSDTQAQASVETVAAVEPQEASAQASDADVQTQVTAEAASVAAQSEEITPQAGLWNLSYEPVAMPASGGGREWKLTDVSVETQGMTAGSIVIKYPDNYLYPWVYTDSAPGTWTKQVDAVNGIVAYTTGGGATADEIKTFLESITLTPSSLAEPCTLQIAIDESDAITVPREDAEGRMHYYRFVLSQGPDAKTWIQAYNAAKSTSYLGLTGYLLTVTSQGEQNFVFDTIAKNPGWMGGTSFRNPDRSMLNDPSSIGWGVTPGDLVFGQGDEGYYWACGPDAGLKFWKGDNTAETNRIDGVFANWGAVSQGYNNQPDGYGEPALEFAIPAGGIPSPYWNNLSWGYLDPSNNKGYYVEFGGYEGEEPEPQGETYAIGTANVIYAEDFTYHVKKGPILSPDPHSGDPSDVFAFAQIPSKEGGVYTGVQVDEDQFAAINAHIAAHELGSYPLTYTLAGATVTIMVTLVGDVFTATNPTPTIQPGTTVTKNELIGSAGVTLTDPDGNPYPNSSITVDQSQLDALNAALQSGTPGIYPVTLFAPDGSSITIYVNVPSVPKKAANASRLAKTGDDALFLGVGVFALVVASTCVLFARRRFEH